MKEEKPFFWMLKNISYVKDSKPLPENYIKDYTPYIINRFLSSHPNCLFDAQEMNELPHLDKNVQYKFYLHSLRSENRFFKWEKREKIKDIEVVAEYYKCSDRVAEHYMKFLDETDIEKMKKFLDKGGL